MSWKSFHFNQNFSSAIVQILPQWRIFGTKVLLTLTTSSANVDEGWQLRNRVWHRHCLFVVTTEKLFACSLQESESSWKYFTFHFFAPQKIFCTLYSFGVWGAHHIRWSVLLLHYNIILYSNVFCLNPL